MISAGRSRPDLEDVMLVPSLTTAGAHTIAEIVSQPDVWRGAISDLVRDGNFERASRLSRKEWLFTGCGTSFYLAETAASCWTILTGQRARAVPASEILLFPQLSEVNQPDQQAVIISRSGRTSEAVRAADVLSGTYKIPTLGITCNAESELAKTCDVLLSLPAADEKSMVMTRSFTVMLLALLQLAAQRAGGKQSWLNIEVLAGALEARIRELNQRVQSFVAKRAFAGYVYLGQGPFFSIAREAALKVTEMSCSYAQAYHTLEFRHGPKAIVWPQTCLTFFLSESGMRAESDVLAEMKELGGTVIAVCNRATEAVRRSSDLVVEFEADVPELALLAPFVVAGQLLGFHAGIKKGFNPDEPKNLTRVVILD